MNPNLQINDLVLILGDTEHDDPVAAEYVNDHGYVQEIKQDCVKLLFLNGEEHTVLIKNIRNLTTRKEG